MEQKLNKKDVQNNLDLLDKISRSKEIHSVESQHSGVIRVLQLDSVRYLVFGPGGRTTIQGGINLLSPRDVVLPYYELCADTIGDISSSGSALCIGLGAGYLPKEVKIRTGCEVEVVEVDKEVEKVAYEFFDFPKNIQVHICDGFNFVMSSTKKYDFINVDTYRGNQIPFQMVTSEFFDKCKSLLTEDGVFSINLCSNHVFYECHLNTLMSVFENDLYMNQRLYNSVVYNVRKHKVSESSNFSVHKIKKTEKIEKSKIFSMGSV